MIGIPKIIATRADLELVKQSAPEVYAQFVEALKGSLVTTADAQTYPDGYDHTLKDGDAGYLPPVIVEVKNLMVIERFGLTEAEVMAL